ncbi:uncharacterized protein LOC127369411 [Dicentrarchus labrax]|uniref:uncharacterized protein LOC127369411 n=1 Tax=Dicentrarchus labrax TaxID=13489 RepID=UPI0021F67E38|nr:uncharacterized protein LOC127369411 [Dicentrarchus labrax]
MANCGTLLKSALVAVVLMAVIHSGSADEKLATCCKKVNIKEITEPITGYMLQRGNLPCVPAVILQTEKGLFCTPVKAQWVRRKVQAFLKAKAQATTSSVVPSSTVSLLSIITSTASPPSSSTPPSSSLPSFISTSEMPAGETFSETDDE